MRLSIVASAPVGPAAHPATGPTTSPPWATSPHVDETQGDHSSNRWRPTTRPTRGTPWPPAAVLPSPAISAATGTPPPVRPYTPKLPLRGRSRAYSRLMTWANLESIRYGSSRAPSALHDRFLLFAALVSARRTAPQSVPGCSARAAWNSPPRGLRRSAPTRAGCCMPGWNR
jgi:hypothetical protein